MNSFINYRSRRGWMAEALVKTNCGQTYYVISLSKGGIL